jgi:hypothetical protein
VYVNRSDNINISPSSISSSITKDPLQPVLLGEIEKAQTVAAIAENNQTLKRTFSRYLLLAYFLSSSTQ